MDEVVNQGALFGSAGLMVLVVFDREGLPFGRIFPGEDFGLGVNAGLQGIRGRVGLAFRGARAGGLLRVEAIRLDLL